MITKHSSLFVAALVAACGSSTSTTAPDVVAYKQLAQQLEVSVSSYRDAGTSVPTVTDCMSVHNNYDSHVRPLVHQMLSMSTGMDNCMIGFGDSTDANFQATCDSMVSELDHHAQTACQSSTLSQDWAETQRHCDAMDSFVQHELSGEGTLAGMMDGMMSGTTCHR